MGRLGCTHASCILIPLANRWVCGFIAQVCSIVRYFAKSATSSSSLLLGFLIWINYDVPCQHEPGSQSLLDCLWETLVRDLEKNLVWARLSKPAGLPPGDSPEFPRTVCAEGVTLLGYTGRTFVCIPINPTSLLP